MRILKSGIALAAVLLASTSTVAFSDQHARLIIDGQEITTQAPQNTVAPKLGEVQSGWLFRAVETQALQLDDFDNPGFIFVDKGMDLFNKVEGSEGKSCASCHELKDFNGLRTKLPRVNKDGTLQTMEDLVNYSRTQHMGAKAWKYSGSEMTAVTALISVQSRGMPMNVAIDGAAKPYWETGKKIYYTRVGQLDLACSNCHEDNYGNMIRADHLSQGQINGFPTYRLKNAKLNSVHARFKGCMKNVRAEPYKVGSDEFKALELYVASRGQGLSVESPSVRN